VANLNRVWKRWMATGCLHSTHACAEYQRNVRAFKAAFQPDRHVELGDLLETTALRSGRAGRRTKPSRWSQTSTRGWLGLPKWSRQTG